MTDEEIDKTEKEYKEWLVHDHKLLDKPTYCDIEQKCFRAFFAGTRYGLAEGRKETIKKIVGVINDNNSTYGDLRESLGIKWADTDLEKENAELKEQIEKMKNIIYEEVDFCTYCPLTHECRNEEGTCPYANATEEEQKKMLPDWIMGS